MEPKALTAPDWSNLGTLIGTLWIVLATVVIFGGAFLTAHVFLPALAPPETLRRLKGLRLALYSISGIAFVAAALLVAQSLGAAPSVIHFYPRLWM